MDKKQIWAAMETDIDKSLDAFNAAAADLMNATYIIISGKISKLLQSIAQSRPLYEYLAGETDGYNFAESFRSRQFRDENGRPYIDVPEEPREQIRFAFCMLFAIDTGKLNIENLLHTFYYNADANTELHDFCAEVVRPFVRHLNAVFAAPDAVPESPAVEESVAATLPLTAESEPQTQSDSSVDSLLASLSDVASELIDAVSKNITLSISRREELLLVCDAFNEAVCFKERKTIRLMYIALKYTLKCSSIFSELEEKYNDLAYLMRGLGIGEEE